MGSLTIETKVTPALSAPTLAEFLDALDQPEHEIANWVV